jgi:hypothetical protein
VHHATAAAFSMAIAYRRHLEEENRKSSYRPFDAPFMARDPNCNECDQCQQPRRAEEEANHELRRTSAISFFEYEPGGENTTHGYSDACDILNLMKRVREHLATLDPEPTPTEPQTTTPSTSITIGTDSHAAPVSITESDRNRHVYMIGKTGSGKSSLLRNVIMQDLAAGRGVIYLDPHGDTAQTLLGYVPPERVDDVVYFCPIDATCPAFNLLAAAYPPDKLTRDVVSAFRMFFGFDQNSAPRLSQILTNTVLLLLLDREHEPHSLADVRRVLIDAEYRSTIVTRCPHQSVTQFWTLEFPRFPKDATLPVLNKFSDLLMPTSPMERIFSNTANALDIQALMDNGKILLVNLSKGELGEAGAFLIGALIITAVNQAALARARIPEHQRRDVFLYVDEFQNFIVDSFESILSEARKYRLNLTLAHQYLAQVPSTLRSAIFGNVAVTICLPISAEDATTMYREFSRSTLAIKATGEVFEPVAYFRTRAKRFLDGVIVRPNSWQQSSHFGQPWPAHITRDARDAGDNCRWFLDTFLTSKPPPPQLTTITWPSMEDLKLLAPLSGFVKINNASNVHRFTIHHPNNKPRDEIRRAILDRQHQEHKTALPTAAEKNRPHQVPQDQRSQPETTQHPHQEPTPLPSAPQPPTAPPPDDDDPWT